ncbi:MAG: hypothetical protein QW472_00955 [Candidatus Aenigmatarchaeota archaeon]
MKKEGFSKGVSPLVILIVVVAILLVAFFLTSQFLNVDILKLIESFYPSIGIWFLLIGLGVFLIILGITITQFTRNISILILPKIGIALMCLSLLFVIINVFLPLITSKTLTYEECKELIDVKNAYNTIACVFVGYSPIEEATNVTYVNFIITSIILPLFFFYYIFKDIINTINFPSDENAQKVIAFVGAYSALRGFLASYFIDFFTYGWFGMGALAFGVFMIMIAWGLVKKYFENIILSENMKKLFQAISGEGMITPKELILLINTARLPYTFLQDHLKDVETFLNKIGYQGLANQIRQKMLEADNKFGKNIGKKNEWLYEELNKLV